MAERPMQAFPAELGTGGGMFLDADLENTLFGRPSRRFGTGRQQITDPQSRHQGHEGNADNPPGH